MKFVPHRRGLYIPPGAAVSQSSEVCAQGEVFSQPRQLENDDQTTPEQTPKKSETTQGRDHDRSPESDGEDFPILHQNADRAISEPEAEQTLTNTSQEFDSRADPAEGNVKQEPSIPKQENQKFESTPILESKEPQDRVSSPAADDAPISAPDTELSSDCEAHVNDLSSSEAVQPAASTSTTGNPDAHQPPRSSVALPIHTIRVHQTTESEEIVPTPAALIAGCPKIMPLAAEDPTGGAPENEVCIPSPTSADCPVPPDVEAPSPATHVAKSVTIVPKLPRVDKISVATPSIGTDHPGNAKLAVRKARNLAGSRLVLGILLGR